MLAGQPSAFSVGALIPHSPVIPLQTVFTWALWHFYSFTEFGSPESSWLDCSPARTGLMRLGSPGRLFGGRPRVQVLPQSLQTLSAAEPLCSAPCCDGRVRPAAWHLKGVRPCRYCCLQSRWGAGLEQGHTTQGWKTGRWVFWQWLVFIYSSLSVRFW